MLVKKNWITNLTFKFLKIGEIELNRRNYKLDRLNRYLPINRLRQLSGYTGRETMNLSKKILIFNFTFFANNINKQSIVIKINK